MKCDRVPSERMVDLTRTGHPNSVKVAVMRFVAGVHKRRMTPVSRGKVVKWLARTPADAVDAALEALIAEGKVIRRPASKFSATLRGMPPGFWLPSDS